MMQELSLGALAGDFTNSYLIQRLLESLRIDAARTRTMGSSCRFAFRNAVDRTQSEYQTMGK